MPNYARVIDAFAVLELASDTKPHAFARKHD